MSTEKRLVELGLTLPEPPAPGGNYLSAKTLGNLVYLSGVISTDASGVITGTAGADRTITDGYAAARACALTQLAVLKRTLGTLDKVHEIISVNGYVNAVAGSPRRRIPRSRPPRARRRRRERPAAQRPG
jgi:enamine deaminase RidA (YjgF/YER057c/UK114 family)